jgi:hypothetical protein
MHDKPLKAHKGLSKRYPQQPSDFKFANSDHDYTGDTKKRELLKNPTKIEEIQEKKFIHRN